MTMMSQSSQSLFSSDTSSSPAPVLTRRSLFIGLGASSLTGCSKIMSLPYLDDLTTGSILPRFSAASDGDASMYAARNDEGFLLPAIPYQKIPGRFRRRRVLDPTGQAPGTIVVDLQARHLYYVLPGGEAVRYGVGIGKDGSLWSGRAQIQYKKKWPVWTPPSEMLARRPDLVQYRNGMEAGLMNPLGARALYIFHDGQDTLFRIHGNPEWQSIGTAVSSGCIRMINQDVIDLYERVTPGTPIIVG